MRHVANFWTANEFRPETKTRTLPAINAKPESENWQSVWRRSAKKQDPPHGQKTYRLAQTKPTVSTQSGGGPSEILFSCHFRLAPKLGRRSPIAKFTYCRHSRKILARPSERRASKKMNQLGPANLRSAELGSPQTSSWELLLLPGTLETLADARTFRCDPKCPFPLDNQNSTASGRKRSRTNHNRQG